jgi:hypothetical protein
MNGKARNGKTKIWKQSSKMPKTVTFSGLLSVQSKAIIFTVIESAEVLGVNLHVWFCDIDKKNCITNQHY